MYRVVDRSDRENVGIKLESKLTGEEYDLLIPYLEHLRQEVGPLNLVFDMTVFVTPHGQECWFDMTDHLRLLPAIRRAAVLGEKSLMEAGTKHLASWQETEVQFFMPGQVEEAWEWVKK